ncbi:MAG: carbamoyltransferase HypF, partial [Gammaproteobacteria bacterium]|nr:carbamoyltransferase HypF [Gammaproteobacteria bacterium]
GGYHLMCDATSAEAIGLLRNRKQRPDKPFAVLMEQSQLDKYVDVSEQELKLLKDNSRPIVLLKHNDECELPDDLAPGINRLGIMLPANPLQHLICHYFKKPLVATSANISGEPITTDNLDATKRLTKLCDAFLHNNREIVRPSDDPVMICNSFGCQLIRTGRGLAPTEFILPFTLQEPVLAVGGHIKNTIALAWKNRMVISAHNGDLSSLRGYRAFQSAINDMQRLYKVKAEHVVCDAHPGYGSTQWVSKSGLEVTKIFHHHAHASSLAIEYPDISNWLIFSWDGVGLGSDGSLWGGETFLGCPGNWQRVVSFKQFRLPGGDKTSRQPWRVAASLCWHSAIDIDWGYDFNINHALLKQLNIIWKKNTYCPQTSAAGRLFSAAASLLELLDDESFEGHAPMLLEALA